jgi:hypothetical protein
MNLAQILSEAIEEQSWEKVEAALELIGGGRQRTGDGKQETENSDLSKIHKEKQKELQEENLDQIVKEIHEVIQERKEDFDENDIEEENEDQDIEEDVIDLDEEEEVSSVRARRVPFEIKKRKNEFIDNKNNATADLKFDKAVRSEKSLANRTIPKRPPAKKIKLSCAICNKKQTIQDPLLVPRKMPGDDRRSRYVCDKCIRHQRGRD